MSAWGRMIYGVSGTIGLGILGVLYYKIGDPLFAMSISGEHQGPFSYVAQWGDDLVPVVIAILLLALWVWVVAGAVQDERTVDQRMVRR